MWSASGFAMFDVLQRTKKTLVCIQFLPFKCGSYPAVTLCNNGKSVLVLQGREHFIFDIIKHYIEWNAARLIWIAFYKNNKNDKCFIKQLPKDLIIYILNLLGRDCENRENADASKIIIT